MTEHMDFPAYPPADPTGAIVHSAFFRQLTALPFVEAIYLYGSRARGDNKPWSDVDLAIAAPEASDWQWGLVRHIAEYADIALKVDCVRLEHVKEGRFRDHIERDRQLLYLKEPDRGQPTRH